MSIELWLAVAPAAFVGLMVGSFLNVAAIRIPRGESVAFPPSRCMHCGHRLHAIDLIPVLSYLMLRGRCRYCRGRISPAYPAGEMAAAAAYAVTAWRVGPDAELAAGLVLASVLIASAHSDLRTMLIPDKIVFSGLVAGIAARLLSHPLPWWEYALGAVLGGGLMFLLAAVSRGGMGGGDIKLWTFIGLMLGVRLTLAAVFAAGLLGSLYGAGLMMAGKYRRRMQVPFAPFIAAGTLPVYWFGEQWIGWYLGLFTH